MVSQGKKIMARSIDIRNRIGLLAERIGFVPEPPLELRPWSEQEMRQYMKSIEEKTYQLDKNHPLNRTRFYTGFRTGDRKEDLLGRLKMYGDGYFLPIY